MAMRIAICDDDHKDIESIQRIIEKYFAEQLITIRIDCFFNAEKLLNSQNEYSLIILDILLNDENGLDISESIHRKSPQAKIIFYSTEVNFAPKSYECHGNGFIVKPPIIKDVYKCLDRIMRTSKDYTIAFKEYHGTIVKIDINKIFFIKSDKRHTDLYLHNRKIKCLRTITEWQGILPENQFMICSRGILVNLRVISINEFNHICFSNGTEIKIAERVKKKFREAYSNYWGQIS